jgi:hypothetical protein
MMALAKVLQRGKATHIPKTVDFNQCKSLPLSEYQWFKAINLPARSYLVSPNES